MSEMITIEAEVNGYISKGISAVQINESGELVMLLTDGALINLGRVKGERGESGRLPVYELRWFDDLGADDITLAKETLGSVLNKNIGEYVLVLNVDGTLHEFSGCKHEIDKSFTVYFTDGCFRYSYRFDIEADSVFSEKISLVSIGSEVEL